MKVGGLSAASAVLAIASVTKASGSGTNSMSRRGQRWVD
jgi:hypothetical protein